MHSSTFGPIEPEYLVIGAGVERGGGRLVGVLAFPDADAVELDDDRRVIAGEADGHAAAVAIDAAAKIDFLFCRVVAGGGAIAAGIEIAGAIAKVHAEPERILEHFVVGTISAVMRSFITVTFCFGCSAMMRGVVAADEAGIALRLRRAAGEHAL